MISSSQRAYIHLYPSFVYFWKILPRCFLLSAVTQDFSSPIKRLFRSDTNTASVFVSSLRAVRDWKSLNPPFQHPSTPSCSLPCVLIIPSLCRSRVFTCLCTVHSFPCLHICNNFFSYIMSTSIVSRQRHSSGGWLLNSHSGGQGSLPEQILG